MITLASCTSYTSCTGSMAALSFLRSRENPRDVSALFGLFIAYGKPSRGIPALFVVTVILAGILGEIVARFFSEPMNHWLRDQWGEGPNRVGSVINNTDQKVAVAAAPRLEISNPN